MEIMRKDTTAGVCLHKMIAEGERVNSSSDGATGSSLCFVEDELAEVSFTLLAAKEVSLSLRDSVYVSDNDILQNKHSAFMEALVKYLWKAEGIR